MNEYAMKYLSNWQKLSRFHRFFSPKNEVKPVENVLQDDLTRQVMAAVPLSGKVLLQQDKSIVPGLDVRIERHADDFVVFTTGDIRNPDSMKIVIERIPAAVCYMHYAGSTVKEVMFHLSDGQLPSMAHCSFSSCNPSMYLVPDYYFFRDRGYRKLREWLQQNYVPWADRSSDLMWRGRLTGAGLFSVDSMQKDNPLVRQRLRMAMHAADTDLDFRFVSTITKMEEQHVSAAGFMADRVPSRSWVGRKYAIDIDGFSNTWDNLFHRMLMGNCVLKVDSQMGFRQWYYDQLVAYEHYVPIKKDLSDLRDQINWVQTHDAEAKAIAQAGRQLADSMTWDSEMAKTGEGLRQLTNSAA